MNLSWKEILEKSLEDRKISRTEKKALREILKDTTESEFLSLRKEAFEMARSTLSSPKDKELLSYLEDLLSLLIPSSPSIPQVSAFFSPGENCRSQIISHFKSAQKKIDICVFTITDNHIRKEIEEAFRRGLSMRIITDNEKAEDEGSDIDYFSRMGIPLRKDNSPLHMHHKFAIFDDRIVLSGSYNWTRGAAEQQENLIITDDPKTVSLFSKEFESLWKNFA